MNDGLNNINLMQSWQSLVDAHVKSINGFLNLCRPVCFEFEKSKQKTHSEQFNIFSLISDLYYRENFHSDIISFFLDTKENHGCGDKFLASFISMLNKLGRNINARCYQDADAIREEGKIDILVKSESTKRAIIIENKINNAGDMPRQLPRYYDYISRNYQNYQIDAIVYITLQTGKEPDRSDWTDEDEKHIDPLLTIIPSYDKTTVNLVDDWLHPSELITNNIDVLSTIRQYSNLIILLNKNIMDTVILEKFYNEIKVGDNFKTAQSIRNMLNELPRYLARRIYEKYHNKCAPFSKVFLYSPNDPRDAVFEGDILGIHVKIDIWCSEDGYDAAFWLTTESKQDEIVFTDIVTNAQALYGSVKAQDGINRVTKHFDLFDEVGLVSFIDDFLKELSEMNKR